MISLALVMIRARFAHAVTIFLLSMVAIGAAVAGPTYVEASQRSIVGAAVASPPIDEVTVAAFDGVEVRADPGDPRSEGRVAASRARAFDKNATATARLDGFDSVFASTFDVAVATSAAQLELAEPAQAVQFRDGACQHVDMVTGRCGAGPGEVLIAEEAAARLGLSVGRTVMIQPKIWVETLDGWIIVPTGRPTNLALVGVYRPHDAAELFWGVGGVREGNEHEPLLVSRATLAAVDHPAETQSITVYPLPGTLTADRLGSLDADLAATLARMRGAGVTPLTAMPKLLDRVQAARAQSAILPTVAAIPLILLCCLVVFLAAASTAQARRVELGMLSLRGTWTIDRWWLGSAEVVLPVLAGGAVGYLFGQGAVWAFTRVTLIGPWPATFSTGAMPQALIAMTAALAAGLLALRRDLSTPAVDLLRRVPARGSKWLARLLQTVTVVVAVAAVVELRSGGQLAGVSLLAPAVIIIAVALIGSAGFDPLMRRWGRRALRRGKPGLALGALHIGRRGGGSRILALLTVAVGLVAFAAIGSDIGTRGRAEQVAVSLGAARVISVQPTTTRALLHAVREVDPEGEFAMAVVPLSTRNGAMPVLAVDTPRLATASQWPTAGNLSRAQVAATIRPELADSVIVRGTGLTLELDISIPDLAAYLERLREEIRQDPQFGGENPDVDLQLGVLTAVLAPLDGSPVRNVAYADLSEGRQKLQRQVNCPSGCRLSHLEFAGNLPIPMTAIVSSVRQTGPDAVLAEPSDLARWVSRRSGQPGPSPSDVGLSIAVSEGLFAEGFGPADEPGSLLPAVTSADQTGFSIPTTAQSLTPFSAARGVGALSQGRAAVLPRIGDNGALIDLELFTRMSEPGVKEPAEVWLGPAAPADAIDRLREAGLVPYRDRTLAAETQLSELRPNAVGLRFLLAMGILCLGLGLGGLTVAAGAERRSRGDELRALRIQGLSRHAAARAGRVSYLILVLTAAVLGALASLAAWIAVGDRMPLVDTLVPGLPVPRWPAMPALLSWGGASLVLATAALALTLALSRAASTRVATSTHRHES